LKKELAVSIFLYLYRYEPKQIPMKKTFTAILISMLVLSVSAQEKQEKKIKTGWKWDGALPAVTYDTDLGFQYGALVEFSNYGDGSTYPDFIEHIYAEVSRFTKGSGIYRIMYQTRHLIPGVYMVTDLSYLPDQANHFYGFNGYESVFNKPWMDEESPDYRTRMFYRYNRNQFRFKNDFEEILLENNLNGMPVLLLMTLMWVQLMLKDLIKTRTSYYPRLLKSLDCLKCTETPLD